MKLAINSAFGYPELSSKERLRLIKKAGFDAVFPAWKPDVDLFAVAQEIRDAGLEIQSVHAPFHSIAKMWEEDGYLEELALQQECIRQVAAIGCPLVISHVFIGFGEQHPTEIGIRAFTELLDFAQKAGVKIAFENTEGEAYFQLLHSRLWDHPAAGFCWDSGHEQCYNYRKDLLALYGDKLLSTHLNDNFGITGESIYYLDDAHVLPLTGIIDWQDAARRLARLNLPEYLTFELVTTNKKDRHTHDEYANWSCEEFLARAHFAATVIRSWIEKTE